MGPRRGLTARRGSLEGRRCKNGPQLPLASLLWLILPPPPSILCIRYTLTGYPALNPLTPRQLLADFGAGVWLTYELEGDFRFRVSNVRGEYGVLSALAFDLV